MLSFFRDFSLSLWIDGWTDGYFVSELKGEHKLYHKGKRIENYYWVNTGSFFQMERHRVSQSLSLRPHYVIVVVPVSDSRADFQSLFFSNTKVCGLSTAKKWSHQSSGSLYQEPMRCVGAIGETPWVERDTSRESETVLFIWCEKEKIQPKEYQHLLWTCCHSRNVKSALQAKNLFNSTCLGAVTFLTTGVWEIL